MNDEEKNADEIISDINRLLKQDFIKDFRIDFDFDNHEQFNENYVTKPEEMSRCNRNHIVQKFLELKNKKNIQSILEIGVCRNEDKSSTYCFLQNKDNSTHYFGIDLENKKFLEDYCENVHTLAINSSEIHSVMKYVNDLGVTKFDFIFIDGHHSVNQCLDDWRYTQFLSDDGIVCLHDTNFHSGPVKLVKFLDSEKFIIEKCCEIADDYGITFITKK